MTVGIIKINITADVENSLAVRQLCAMLHPGAAVQERDTSHPVRMIVENEKVKRPVETPEQGERDVMKVSRAVKDARRRRVAGRHSVRERPLEGAKAAKRTGQTNSRAPVLHRNYARLKGCHEFSLGRQAAVQIQYAKFHAEHPFAIGS
jgi:hypothetical protein